MDKNVGKTDKIARIGVGASLVFMALPFAGATFGGTVKIIVGVVGAYLFLTGVMGWDPLYSATKMSTHKVSDADMKDLLK